MCEGTCDDYLKLLQLHQQPLFQQVWKSTSSESRVVLKGIIGLILGRLLKTRANGTELHLSDISSYSGTHVGPIECKLRPSCYHLAKGSDSTATSAVLTDTCFKYPPRDAVQWPWNLTSKSGWFGNMLYTQFSVSTHSPIELDNETVLNHGRSFATNDYKTHTFDYSKWKFKDTRNSRGASTVNQSSSRGSYHKVIEERLARKNNQKSSLHQNRVSKFKRVRPSSNPQPADRPSLPRPTKTHHNALLCGKDLSVRNSRGGSVGNLRLWPASTKSPIKLNHGSSQGGICADWEPHAYWKAELDY